MKLKLFKFCLAAKPVIDLLILFTYCLIAIGLSMAIVPFFNYFVIGHFEGLLYFVPLPIAIFTFWCMQRFRKELSRHKELEMDKLDEEYKAIQAPKWPKRVELKAKNLRK